MPFLVDANVLSEPMKQQPVSRVIDWLLEHETELSVDPVILGELEYGILSLPAGRRRTRLLDWFRGGIARLHLIPIDHHTGHAWANLLADLKRRGQAMPVKDSLIAATAIRHGLTIATRNTKDYRHAGVKVVNPFA